MGNDLAVAFELGHARIGTTIGLFMAPAGVIMALAGEAMRPERRAIGMGVPFTLYHATMTVVPPLSGMVFDHAGTARAPTVLAACQFAAVVPSAMLRSHIRARAGLSPASARTRAAADTESTR